MPPADVFVTRQARVRATAAALGIDALVVTHLPGIAYLAGFTGSAGILVLAREGAALVTDGRYRTALDELAAAGQLAPGLDVQIAGGAFEPAVAGLLAGRRVRVCGIEAASMPVGQFRRLERAVSAAGRGAELVQTEGIVESARLLKDAWEQETLREAAARLSAVAVGVLADLRSGLREVDVAQALEAGLRRTGFAKPAFDTMVASGPASAQPHARAGERCLAPGDLVVVDFGGVFRGYAVDLTRTVAVGPPGPEARRLYEAVFDAQAAAIEVVRPGVPIEAVDRAARQVLDSRGFGTFFVHGTGHGLGLEVHEAPRVAAAGTARTAPAEGARIAALPVVLEPGMVFTIEPGAYLPGFGGVRIEDDVLVTLGGCEVLTTVDRALRVC